MLVLQDREKRDASQALALLTVLLSPNKEAGLLLDQAETKNGWTSHKMNNMLNRTAAGEEVRHNQKQGGSIPDILSDAVAVTAAEKTVTTMRILLANGRTLTIPLTEAD